jgi:hypothetical protein
MLCITADALRRVRYRDRQRSADSGSYGSAGPIIRPEEVELRQAPAEGPDRLK